MDKKHKGVHSARGSTRRPLAALISLLTVHHEAIKQSLYWSYSVSKLKLQYKYTKITYVSFSRWIDNIFLCTKKYLVDITLYMSRWALKDRIPYGSVDRFSAKHYNYNYIVILVYYHYIPSI